MFQFLKNLWDTNKKELNRLSGIVEQINALEPQFQQLSNDELRAKTAEYKQRLSEGETLDQLLPEAFATVREAAVRTLGQRPFDSQLIGGIVLHEGKIAEMKTGEGKTLAATLPVYLNALTGRGVHVVTVNDYLARRDSEWMGSIYTFLGLSVGVILHSLDYEQRKAAYAADVTYGTNNEFGFDYLRDNMTLHSQELVQRELNYAIVDEVDSILIDEARTPLIISGQAQQSTDWYRQFAKIVIGLRVNEHYTVDEKAHAVSVTESGVAKVEQILGIDNLYENEHNELVHYLTQALKAKELMKRDRDYIVKDGEIVIVDEFTGRLMFGRRFSAGLHQAIEAKENVKVAHENQTLASITFQNYFRMYQKLGGMTGTAETEEVEFTKIYGLEVVVIPTNKPMIRVDHPDVVFKTEKAKFDAVVKEIQELYAQGQPVLVGTISIEKSEFLSNQLKRKGIPHQVLNAKYHEKEAEIIAQAGRLKTVTIATNMAGRGTDIILGGNPNFLVPSLLVARGIKPDEAQESDVKMALEQAQAECLNQQQQVIALGGLHIIGTERHESRRIDNQLRGRSGRQGDPGSSRFYVSMEDDLMRLFGGDTIARLMERMGWEENIPIEHPQIARSIENAQKRVEARNFDIRKHVLEYDDVLNLQRENIYSLRRQLLTGTDVHDRVIERTLSVIENLLENYTPEKIDPDEWDLEGLAQTLNGLFPLAEKVEQGMLYGFTREELQERIKQLAMATLKAKEEAIGSEQMRELERIVLLRTIDTKWMEHLDNMDDLRDGIGLRAYGQHDPLVAYKFEAFQMFKEMINAVNEDMIRLILRMQLVRRDESEQPRVRNVVTNRGADGGVSGPGAAGKPAVAQRKNVKIGRNDPCPCGSGKKYKKCCGANG
ncbi:MAG TPA: preprotein translocase subunit SecA [Firmicutes bacterium]|jgi:preprotein translocase subunit SecA|nr:preprotein translocase subunit SecA [Bacillota bacterium]HCF92720.1 preprotein translocase subunit SecA [Bacillota bacterium]HCX71151.1 preprotein translocase subunit SecA [Bacillota bacterium]